jgi:hypothetical protein
MAIKSYLSQFDDFGMSVSVNGNVVPQRSRAEFDQWLTARPGRQGSYEKAKAEMQIAQQRAKAAERQATLEKARKRKSFWDFDWEGGDSDCFSSLSYSKNAGGVFAEFANKTTGEWFYEMSRKEAREWLIENGDAPGEYFNDEIR